MCILCVVQKWSRRIATMLPWLVIPLIGLWALSQLLPPGFRFEITSPRLACVLVLLVTLFWYEILMPQLSAWRARRSARLRERRLFEAMEMQKLRKTATRRCRNCLTPYRDQKPGGGRFMCSYCGHISKRPVLDIPGSAALSNNGFFGDLVGKGGKIWNGKAWSENGWICNQDWSENGSWVPGLSSSCRRNENPFFSGEDRCFAKNSYSGVVVFACKMLASFFMSIKWLWRKIFRVGSAREDALSDNEHQGHLLRKGQNGVNDSESRGEKARRKAEEKRQARLERELLEEEEKKQREEVARLVEERRRIRDEKLEADKECSKGLANSEREQDNRRETVKRNQEKKKDKDKGSSKSNSDCEELEKKVRRESEKKREFDKRGEVERRDSHKTVRENFRVHGSEAGYGIKGTGNTFVRGNAVGNRYFDRMKGSFLSSSKAFNGANFFGRAAHTSSPPVAKVNKLSSGFGDHVQASTNRKEVHSAEPMTGKFASNGDHSPETTTHQHVGPDLQPRPTVPKKSWQQLFTRSSSSDANMVSQLNHSQHIEVKSPTMPGQTSSSFYMDNQIHFGQSLPFNVSPLSSGSMSSSSAFSTKAEPQFPFGGESHHDFMHEEAELFEDPCYVPDPMSLLGPVSESLDNFPLDLGTGFLPSAGLERSHVLKTVSSVAEVNRPSPIESPLSRLRVAEERRITSGRLRSTPQTWGPLTTPKEESSNIHEEGTWQMWGTPPLGQDGLGLVGGPVSWLLPLGQNKPNVEDSAYAAASHKPMLSQIEKDYRVIPGVGSPQNVHLGIGQNGGTFSPIGSGLNDSDIWLQKSVGQPFLGDKEIHFPPLNAKEDLSCKEMLYDGSSGSERNQLFEPSPGNCWSKRDWVGDGQGECVGNSTQAIPGLESLFSSQDVESLWSFN